MITYTTRAYSERLRASRLQNHATRVLLDIPCNTVPQQRLGERSRRYGSSKFLAEGLRRDRERDTRLAAQPD